MGFGDALLGLGGVDTITGLLRGIQTDNGVGGLIKTAIGAATAPSNNNLKNNPASVKSQNVVSAVTGLVEAALGQGSASSIPGGTYNVLNDYRSYTYQWTLACLGKNALKNPKSYKKNTLDYVIAKSGGKGNGMKVPSAGVKVAPAKKAPDQEEYLDPVDTVSLVKDFNASSPGRFDLFIDGVEMECVVAPGEKQGNSIATNIKFDIHEPYSLNGFIEALHVSAVSAGYPGYMGTPYILKLDFWGYPDADDLGEPKLIPNSSRYFVFTFTEVNITVTEQGTKYSCQGVPNNEMAFSLPDTLLTDIKMTGATVGEVLKNLFDNINETVKNRAEQEKKGSNNSANHDIYEIYMPPPSTGNGAPLYKLDSSTLAGKGANEIDKASMASTLLTNSVIKMVSPEAKSKPAGGQAGATGPTSGDTGAAATPQEQGVKYEPYKSVFQFAQESHISDVISAVIRDSLYLGDVIKDVKKAADKNGMITYFLIQINVVPLDKDDELTGIPLNKYQYIVIPYKVHFSKLPLQKNTSYEPGTLENVVNRTYNYFYTGQNVDILNFHIKFNNLFYQATPPKAGNVENTEHTTSVSPAGTDKVAQPTTSAKDAEKKQIAQVDTKASPAATSNKEQTQAGAKRTDPYLQFAQAAHKAIMESVDQVEGDIDIIGDPYYLVMGGMGNDIPDILKPGLTTEGTADHQGGQVIIKINFNNPIDIDETTGLMYFRKEVSYSGVYNVINVKSTFKDGQFKQTLHVLRLSGQVSDSDEGVKVQDPVKLTTVPKAGSQVKEDTAKNVERAGVRASTFDLTSLLSRGLPSPGLPGMLSDFTGSLTNPLGSLASGAGSLLSSAQGAIGSAIGGLGITNGLSIGNSLNGINPLAGGIRIPSLPSVASLGSAASITAAGNIVSSALNSPGAVTKLGAQLSAQASSAASVLSAGALSSPSASSIIPSVNDLTNLANNVGTNAMAAVGKLGDAGNSLIKNVGSSIDSLTKGLPSDPSAVAAKLGIDPSAIAGLDPSLQGKLGSQLADITKNIPTDVDLDTLKKSGVSLANISGPALKNIPATAKEIVDGGPELPDTKINSVEALSALKEAEANIAKLGLGANINLGKGVNLAQLNASLPKIPGISGSIPGMSDLSNATALAGQLGSAQNLLGSVTGAASSIEGNLLNTANLIGGNPIAGQSLDSFNSLKNSVATKFGSITASTPSALTKFMNNATSEG
jgi:hypothetical protein